MKIFIFSIIFCCALFAYADEKNTEISYSETWCKKQGGDSQAILSDGTRPDCLLDNAIEFDFGYGMKPYECTGQALHYAKLTGKSPLCILIKKEGISDKEFSRAVNKVHVQLQCMDKHGEIFICPNQ